MRRTNRLILGLAISLSLVLVSCVSAEDLVATEHETLSLPGSILVYEMSFTTSGATGKCSSSVTDRWYGANEEPSTIAEDFEEQLASNGWETWPEDVVTIWRKETRDGIFTLSTSMFTHGEEINSDQVYYDLPESILSQLTGYRTGYVISISYMSIRDATYCFGQRQQSSRR